ncbi:hypothetical protein B7463_g11064, partial [Scytalidium lignicola]
MYGIPIRVIIRVCVTDIPGNPLERVYQLGSDFCTQMLARPFRTKVQEEGYDAMHILPNFDPKNSVKAWFLYDFNVTRPLSKEEVLQIQHEAYLATRQEDSWIFTLQKGWIDPGKNYYSKYVWGGKVEQEWLANANET